MKMSKNEDWNVEKYKTEYESDEHWELKRDFLLAHKDKFEEDELVCLAQAFVNVESLGCSYPKKTMELIAELSKDIVAEYREKQKKKLQRTFVKASEAASIKVKGHTAQVFTTTKESSKRNVTSDLNSTQCSTEFHNQEVLSKRMKTETNDLPYSNIILVERPGDAPQTILVNAVNLFGGNIEWKFSKTSDLYECTIYINSKDIAHAACESQKMSKREAATVALDKLRKRCYTIKIKQNLNEGTQINLSAIEDVKPKEHIPDDNIGKRLMKLMGWSGGGLGKSQQGIIEPVTLQQQLSRKGLGLHTNSLNIPQLKAKCSSIFEKFLIGDMENDIVFSDFTKHERKAIHVLARKMGLKSRSFGPEQQRRMIISRKIDIRSLAKELINLGGTTEKYELLKPTEEGYISTLFYD